MRDNLGAIATRFEKLQLDDGGLHISRHTRAVSKAVSVKSVVMYSVAWVKSQSRMASTSNQESFRAEIAGRVVFDVLRQVSTVIDGFRVYQGVPAVSCLLLVGVLALQYEKSNFWLL